MSYTRTITEGEEEQLLNQIEDLSLTQVPFPTLPVGLPIGNSTGTTTTATHSANPTTYPLPLTDTQFRARVETAMQKSGYTFPCGNAGSSTINVLLSLVHDSILDVQTVQCVGKETRCRVRFTYLGRNASGTVTRKVTAAASHKKVQLAMNLAKDNLLYKLYPPVTQGDDGTIHGDQDQGADLAGNTIITHDAGTTDVADKPISIPKAVSICSTERLHHFPTITDRWMALATVSVAVNSTGRLAQWLIPQDLYRKTYSSVNMLPFESFLYCKLAVEFKFMVNSSQFNTGKLIAFIVHDPFGLEPNYLDDTPTATSRPHVILDLATNTEGNLLTSQRYRRTFTRTKQDSARTGHPVRVALQSALNLHVLSPLTAASGQPNSVDITVFFRLADNNFAGMTWRDATPVAYQMDTIGEMATGALTGGIKPLVVKAERLIRQLGNPHNTDKPVDLESTVIVPRPRKGFYTARGPTSAVPLRHCADGTTTIHPELSSNDPTDLMQIGQMWGLSDRFTWSVTSTSRGTLLYSVTPSIGTGKYLTPADYIGLMFGYFSGTIDYRFDFVTCGFHQGSVTISAEFGSDPESSSVSVAQHSDRQFSTYHSTFHLGQQKSMEFTVPYIYDTAYRRRPHPLVVPSYATSTTFNTTNELNMAMATKLIVRICNPLVPITNVAQSIEVLVFKRLGNNFGFHSPCSMGALLRSRSNPNSSDSYGYFPNLTTWPETTSTAQLNSATVSGKRQKPTYTDAQKLTIEDGAWRRYKQADRTAWIESDINNYRVLTRTQIDIWWRELTPQQQADFKKRGIVPQDQMMEDEEVAAPTFEDAAPITRFYQCSDANTNIKDNLRNPIMVYAGLKVPAQPVIKAKQTDWQALFIPVAPPQDFLITNIQVSANDLSMVSTVEQSRQCAILRMFRHWRGENVYHLNFWYTGTGTPTTAPIYVAYIPHTGSWQRGIRTVYNDSLANASSLVNQTYDILGSGLAFDVVYPHINPAPTFTVPFTHPNNWCVLNERGLDSNLNWRDRTDWLNGHLMIYTRQDQNWKVDILWEAGDSFTVADYIGIPPMTMPSTITETDAHPTVQMDDDDRPSGFSGVLTRLQRAGAAATDLALKHSSVVVRGTALAAVSTVSPTLATSIGTVMFLEKAEDGINSLKHTGQTIGAAATETSQATIGAIQSVSETATDLTTNFTGTIGAQLTTFIASVSSATGKAISVVKDLLIDLLISLQAQDWKVTCLCILRFFTNIGLLTIDMALSAGEKLYQIIRRVLGLNPVQQLEGDLDEINDSDKANLIGLLMTLVCTSFKTAISEPPKKMFTAFFASLTELKTLSFANQAIRLCNSLFSTIQKVIQWVIRKVNPAAGALELYSGKKELVDEFIRNANYVMNPVNQMMKSTPLFRIRAWLAFIEAQRIREIIVKTDAKGASPALGVFVNKYLTWIDSNYSSLRASPVRYEPFVIRISGPSKIGKSFMINELIPRILQGAGIRVPSGEPIWTRTSGNPYWNSVGDQPVILYDDWMQTRDPSLMATECAELFALKSTAVFNPTKARLEEKDDRINPYIVVLLCNNGFPDAPVASREALWRRADMAWEVEWAPGRREPVRGDDTFPHMQFRYYTDSARADSLRNRAIDYQAAAGLMQRAFNAYHQNEQRNVGRRLDKIRELAVGDDFMMQDPFSFLYNAEAIVANDPELRGPNAATPAEVLAAQVLAHRARRQAQQAALGPEQAERNPFNFQILPNPNVPVENNTPSNITGGIFGHFNRIAGAASFVAAHDYIVNNNLYNLSYAPTVHNRPGDGVCLACMDEELTLVTMCPACGKGLCAQCHFASTLVEEYRPEVCGHCRGEGVLLVMRIEEFMKLTVGQKMWNHAVTACSTMVDIGVRALCVSHIINSIDDIMCNGEPIMVIPWLGLVGVGVVGQYEHMYERMPSFIEACRVFRDYIKKLPAKIRQWIRGLVPSLTARRLPMAQADEDDETFLDSEEDVEDYGALERMVMRNYSVVSDFNLFDQFEHLVEGVHEQHINKQQNVRAGICHHYTFTQNASYWEGNFHIIDERGRNYTVPEHICQDTVGDLQHCAWSNLATWRNAMRGWAAHHAELITRTRRKGLEDQQAHLPVLFRDRDYLEELGQEGITGLDWHKWLKHVPDVIKKAVPYLMAATGVFLAYKSLQAIFSTFMGAPADQIISSGDNVTARAAARSGVAWRRSFKSATTLATTTAPTTQLDEGLIVSVRTKILKNTFVVTYKKGETQRSFIVLGVRGGYFIFLNHYLNALESLTEEERNTVKIAPWLQPFVQQKLQVAFNDRNCIRSEIRDFAIVNLASLLPPCADIVKYMRGEDEADKVLPATAEFMDLSHKGQDVHGTGFTIREIKVNGRVPEIAVSSSSGLTTRADSISYNYERNGACGCTLIDARANKPLLAVHYAGYTGRRKGLGIPLIREDFEDAFAELAIPAVERDELPTYQLKALDETRTFFDEDVRVNYCSGVASEFTPHLSAKTTIKKSLVTHELPWEPITEPAILSMKDPRYNPEFTISPLVAGVSKHGRTWAPIGLKLCDVLEEDTAWMLKTFKPTIANPQFPTWEEAAVGLPGIKGYEPLKLDTSAGWPWTQLSRDKSKRWLIDYKRDAQEMPIGAHINTLLLQHLEKGWERRKAGFAQPTVFMNFLKDERRKITKARSLGGTRIICGSPIDLTLTSRRVFMHYNAAFKNTCILGSHAVGINPYSSDWDLLAKYLLEVGNNIIAIDYSDFGPSISTDLVRANIESKAKWLRTHCPAMFKGTATEEEWNNIFECLKVENAHGMQICNDVIFEPLGGAPSGKDATAEDNSDFNRKLLRVVWLALTGKNISEMERAVRTVVYGDDVLMSVSDDYKDVFNANSICRYLASIGIKCSDESKQSVFPDFRTLDQVSFLKNNFVYNQEIRKWVAAMDKTAALEVCHWIRKSPDDGAQTISNCMETMRFVWGYGRVYFNEILSKINQALLAVELDPLVISWDGIKIEFFPDLM